MRLDPDQATLMKQVGKQYQQFTELMTELRTRELESLSNCNEQTFCTQKGRVQMLTELLQHLRP